MGAHTFDDVAYGRDVADAYDTAVQNGYYEYGHQDGYNGTISTTNGYVEVTKPRGWSDNDLVVALDRLQMWTGSSDRWDAVEVKPIVPVRRKFASDWDRLCYESDRRFATRWSRLDLEQRQSLIRVARRVEKWGPCAAWRADRNSEVEYRKRRNLKGKRGGLFVFWGWAAT
jgi:hypothetical protein